MSLGLGGFQICFRTKPKLELDAAVSVKYLGNRQRDAPERWWHMHLLGVTMETQGGS